MKLSVLLLIFICILTSSSVQINYVIPSNHLLPQICKTNPCLSLDEYVQQAEIYFVPGSTFHFLAGNHTLRQTISLSGMSNLTLTGDPLSNNSSSKVYLSQEAFFFNRSTNVTIKKLDFLTAPEITFPSQSVFSFESSRIRIVDTRFEGSGNVSLFMLLSSTIEIMGSTFKGCVAESGAVIRAVASDIMATDCYFLGNKAPSTGGVVLIEFGTIRLERTYFKNNFAIYGGVIACENCSLSASDVAFIDNSALYYGGALYLSNSNVFLAGVVLFHNNRAEYGGAVTICTTFL